MSHFTNLAIAGGGFKIAAAVGCIKYLEEIDELKYIKNFVGTSAGSVICLGIILGYKHEDFSRILFEFITKFKFEPNLMDIVDNYGISDGNVIIELISNVLELALNVKDITFLDLTKKTGKNLSVCVSNITDNKEDYFNIDTTPELSICTAIRISCSLPILFTPIMINDKLYLDGGLFCNFPINYFKKSVFKDILGININVQKSKNINNLGEYIIYILDHLLNKTNQSITDPDNNIITLDFPEDDHDIYTLAIKDISQDTLKKYIDLGYEISKKKYLF